MLGNTEVQNSALFQFAQDFRIPASMSLTQAFWVCSAEADEAALLVEVASVDVFGCEREDEA